MGMSKQDFIALADTIKAFNADHIGRASYKDSPRFTDDQIKTLADFCRQQGPNFNRERWMDYVTGTAGVSGGNLKKAGKVATLALLLVGTFGGLAHGQELPDAPRPKPETFLHNRVNRGLVISAFVARAADAQSTEQALHNACHCVTEGGSFYGLAPLAPVAERPAAFWMYSMTMATAESYAAKVLWDHANHSHHPKAYKIAARGLLAWNANANFADARVNWSHDRKATAIYGRK